MKNIHITSWFPYFGQNGEKKGKKTEKNRKNKKIVSPLRKVGQFTGFLWDLFETLWKL